MYNGWENWATWTTSMIVLEDEYVINELAKESDIYDLAQSMEDYFDNLLTDICGYDPTSIVGQFADATIATICWQELAEHAREQHVDRWGTEDEEDEEDDEEGEDESAEDEESE